MAWINCILEMVEKEISHKNNYYIISRDYQTDGNLWSFIISKSNSSAEAPWTLCFMTVEFYVSCQ